MSQPIIVLVHGWGFDPSIWDRVVPLVSAHRVAQVDLGFFGRPSMPAIPDHETVLGVGHSLGMLWLLCAAPFRIQGLVSFDGFPRFCEDESFRPAVPGRILDRMRARFATEPGAVLAEFRTRCGAGTVPFPEGLDAAKLGEGLSWLSDWDGRERLKACRSIWALAGRNDPIVPAVMTTHAFDLPQRQETSWHDQPGHLTPWTEPVGCARMIERAIECVS